MKFLLSLCVMIAPAGSASRTDEPKQGKPPSTFGVIVLLDARTNGLTEGAKLKAIQLPRTSAGKRTINDAKSKGKDEPRLNGQYVVKTCTLLLADGTALRDREVLVAVEVGGEALRDLQYVETCEGKSDRGPGKWYAYTAVAQRPGPRS